MKGEITIREAVIALNDLLKEFEADENNDKSKTILALQAALLLFRDFSQRSEYGVDTKLVAEGDE